MKKLLSLVLVMGMVVVGGATSAMAAERGQMANVNCPNSGICTGNGMGRGENRNETCLNSDTCPNDGVRKLDGTGFVNGGGRGRCGI